MEKLPNFLIAGAAKSGTTSLYYYLMDHPEIFFSANKEPSFLSADRYDSIAKLGLPTREYINSIEEYRQLFSQVGTEKAIGEASTDTLYYFSTSIPRIKQYLGEPKIIIILRNPPMAAFSMWTHMVRDNRETLSFEDALDFEDDRITHHAICAYHYKVRALYFEQVKAFQTAFPEVKCYIYEEFIKNINGTIRDICEFLDVDPAYQPSKTLVYNASGIPRHRWINDLFIKYAPFRKVVRKIGTSLLSSSVYAGLRDEFRQKNMVKVGINPKTYNTLKDYYKKDILALQDLLNRDLSIWLDK